MKVSVLDHGYVNLVELEELARAVAAMRAVETGSGAT